MNWEPQQYTQAWNRIPSLEEEKKEFDRTVTQFEEAVNRAKTEEQRKFAQRAIEIYKLWIEPWWLFDSFNELKAIRKQIDPILLEIQLDEWKDNKTLAQFKEAVKRANTDEERRFAQKAVNILEWELTNPWNILNNLNELEMIRLQIGHIL